MRDAEQPFLDVAGIDPHGRPAPGGEELIEQAELLAGGRDILGRLAPAGVRTLALGRGLDQALDELGRALDQGLRVVVLADGDPMHFGVGRRLAERFGPGRLRVLPAVSSMQLAAARLGVPQEAMRIVSLHGRRDYRPLYRAAMQGGTLLALTDAANGPGVLARALLERGAPPFRARVLERLGREDENIREFDPGEPDLEFVQPNLAAFDFFAPPPHPARPGLPDHVFERQAGLMTKGPVRAVGLARLSIAPDSTVWDVGAGSGAVSVEASALLPTGGVWAVEADAGRAAIIRENRRRTGACLVEVVHGRAPDCLDGLPAPDRVFIGGGLSCGDSVLEAAWERLRPGGRLVAHLALLSGLERVRRFFLRRGASVELDMVQASSGAELAGDLRLAAHNPVFIISANKEAS